MHDRWKEAPLLTRSGRHSPTGRDRERRDADDLSAYGAILDEHEKHVFDYCSRLVGDEAAAASATETAMVAAQSLLADPDRLRAWLFALARQDIAAKIQPSDQNQDAEILDLVYRHGIRPGDLPAVLGVPPEHASAMLASAQALADAEAEAGAEAEVDPSTDTDAAGEADASAVAYAPAEIDGRAEDMLASPDEPGEVGEVGPGWAPGGDPRPDSGSVEAFTALFDAYARHVYDYCGSLLGDQAAAADATQVTLTVACMLVARLDSHFRVRAWLLALARAACKSTDPGRREEPLPSDRLGLSELLGSRHHAGDEIANTGQGELNSDADVSEGPEGPVLAGGAARGT